MYAMVGEDHHQTQYAPSSPGAAQQPDGAGGQQHESRWLRDGCHHAGRLCNRRRCARLTDDRGTENDRSALAHGQARPGGNGVGDHRIDNTGIHRRAAAVGVAATEDQRPAALLDERTAAAGNYAGIGPRSVVAVADGEDESAQGDAARPGK